jgi:hypothetical protein
LMRRRSQTGIQALLGRAQNYRRYIDAAESPVCTGLHGQNAL